jgi:pimeloyl-ACP methyl ester carboxylesterase
MPPPLICIGQSWGGYPAISTALLHPRLFVAVIALEPFLVSDGGGGFAGLRTALMARRRDVWASREGARKAMLRNPYYAAFDSAVFEQVVRWDLRLTGNGEEVTLVTPKAMEVATMMRSEEGEPERQWTDFTGTKDQQIMKGFYRAEPTVIRPRLAEVRPPVLYVFATNSIVGKYGYPEWLLEHTGSGEMGSGGVKKDMVNVVWIQDSGHPMPLEKPKETAEAMVPWIKKQIQRSIEESETNNGEFHITKINPAWMEKLEKL